MHNLFSVFEFLITKFIIPAVSLGPSAHVSVELRNDDVIHTSKHPVLHVSLTRASTSASGAVWVGRW